MNVVRSFQDDNHVVTHTDYNFFGPKVGFDVFRFEDGLIVEHWDNLAEKAHDPNPSGHTQLDGPTEVLTVEETEPNKAFIREFVETILVKGEMNKLDQYIDGDNYVQHNSTIGDGISGLRHALEAMAKQGIEMTYSTIHKVLGEGNYVLSISEGMFSGNPTSFYDLFRIENGKLVEHWDVLETILLKDQWKHTNGKFGFK